VSSTTHAPRVLAVLVTHDGAPWLARTLAALARQTYPELDVIAVDNASTDGSRELLLASLGPDRVLVSEDDIGFGAAVSFALDAADGRIPLGAERAPLVLLLHDDLLLRPSAVAELVAALESDPRVAIVGPKLRHWGTDRRLQAVGSTIDLSGRVDDGVDPGEIDQGQRDDERRVLYVSTAGMLVRRAVFDELGRFDHRYRAFRDDLDLCWRAAIAGHDTEVVPAAVAIHAGVAANLERTGRTAELGPRFLAERNTLATLLKCYQVRRLLVVLPLALLVGIAKVVGFVLTRRVVDATQTVRAWAWNVVHLRATLRARRRVREQRVRTDAELADLFGRVSPRLRAYAEAIVAWVAGGDASDDLPDDVDPDAESPSVVSRLRELARQQPILVAAVPLLVLLVVGAWPLLLPGSLRGGDLAPWPATAAAFLQDHVSGWHDVAGLGTPLAPSPAQAVLAGLHLAVGGSAYLAPRVLLFGTLVVAWVMTLKATQRLSPRRAPRVAAATAYVVSPPALAAVTTGRVGALVLLAALPTIAAAAASAADPATPLKAAWRSVAALVVLLAVVVAFEPWTVVLVVVGVLVALDIAAIHVRDAARRRSLLVRTAVVGVGPFVLLAPWSFAFLTRATPLAGIGEGTVGGPVWRWILMAPPLPGMPGILGGIGAVLAGLLGIAFGLRRLPGPVVGAWTALLMGGVLGWAADGLDLSLWPGTPLVVTAAGGAALLAIAFGSASESLAGFAFGWRQSAFLVTAVGVGVTVVTIGAGFATEDWQDVRRDEPALPEFVVAAAAEAPTRVLVAADVGGLVVWELMEGRGPTMAAFGSRRDPAVEGLVDAIVDDLVSGRDPRASSRLGRAGVRYVVVPEGGTSEALDLALRMQLALEPQPVPEGRVLEVRGWIPGATVVAPGRFDERVVPLPPDPVTDPGSVLERLGPGRYAGPVVAGGTLLLAEPFHPGWELRVDDTLVPAVDDSGLVRFDGVPAGERAVLRNTASTRRSIAVSGQVLVLLLVVSLGLRPPMLGRARAQQRSVVDLGDDLTDETDGAARGAAGGAGGDGAADGPVGPQGPAPVMPDERVPS
jgi:GT2 family glycosyltransferase